MNESTGIIGSDGGLDGGLDAHSRSESIAGADTGGPHGRIASTRGEGFTTRDMIEYGEWSSDLQFD